MKRISLLLIVLFVGCLVFAGTFADVVYPDEGIGYAAYYEGDKKDLQSFIDYMDGLVGVKGKVVSLTNNTLRDFYDGGLYKTIKSHITGYDQNMFGESLIGVYKGNIIIFCLTYGNAKGDYTNAGKPWSSVFSPLETMLKKNGVYTYTRQMTVYN